MNALKRQATRAATKANVWLYRRTKGRVGGQGIGKLPLMLLTVRGRSTGASHTVPVVYFDHVPGYLVVGTGMGGSSSVPQWFLNLQAAGKAHLQVRGQEHDADAHVVSDAEAESLWPQIAVLAPHFANWQTRTGRMFPIARLTIH